ncbi:hypothetical protein HMPREF9005_1492 [Actinomyces sp. oral taxon 178 str. F0338]|nr:hypothetical protein HMPREF9005_1492 [Actinomyces sp. oral taxon 178 str. F0338]
MERPGSPPAGVSAGRALVDGDGVLAAALRARGIAVRVPAGS